VQQLLAFPLGATVQLNIIGTAADSRAQAVAADPPTWLPPTASVSTHVTISVALGAKAVEAGHLIKDALQLAASADPAGPVVSGAGTYQHLQEPLPLVGRLGVKVALPSGQAVVVHSVDELAAGGYVSLCSDDIDTFYTMHNERVKRVSGEEDCCGSAKGDQLTPSACCGGCMLHVLHARSLCLAVRLHAACLHCVRLQCVPSLVAALQHVLCSCKPYY
jgi:hypothetical protein